MDDTYTPKSIEDYISQLRKNPSVTVTKVVDTDDAVVVYVTMASSTGLYNGPFAYLRKARKQVEK